MAHSVTRAVLVCALVFSTHCRAGSLVPPPAEQEDASNLLPVGPSEVLWYEGETSGVCVPDEGGHVPAMELCLTLTSYALRHYIRSVAKGQSFNFCRRFESSLSCVEEVTSLCPGATSSVGERWLAIIEQLNCICRTGAERCSADLQCTDRELRGSLAQHCDDLHRFNLQQTSADRCLFAQENIDCKVALVWSACGAIQGQLTHNVLTTLAQKRKTTAQCDLSWNDRYTGFRYHADCPTIFLSDMRDSCHIHEAHSVQFEEDNILIASDSPNDVRDACKYYRGYVLCMRSKKKACPEGNRLLNTISPAHRVYLLKMEFICERKTRQVYTRKLTCLQETLRNSSWQNCSNIRNDLKAGLEKITAFEFYCQKHSVAAERVREKLRQFRACSARFFSSHCGRSSGQIMVKFMDVVFEDPEVLHLEYEPDCKLLRGRRRQSNFVPTLPYSHNRHRHQVKRRKHTPNDIQYRPPRVVAGVSSTGHTSHTTTNLGKILMIFAAVVANVIVTR